MFRFFKHLKNKLYFILGFLYGRRHSGKVYPKIPTPSISKYSDLPTISRATHNGKMTGFEPQKLKNYKLYQHELMFGEPGNQDSMNLLLILAKREKLILQKHYRNQDF